MKQILCTLTVALVTTFTTGAAESREFHKWAQTPPMGWNSWDCFGATVNEEQTRANVDYMAEKLAKHGWQYIIVDIQWYEPQSTGWEYARNPKPVIDEFGRLWPVIAKFPSSTNGNGFKPLADYVHGKGLKFGVHLMRGIPREAVKRNTKVMGTEFTALQIANTNSICRWNPDMYGVDMSKPGAQEYYNSVFELLASWGIDYIKVDDLSSPYHKAEIEAIRKAIDRTGRPILLSTSPGPTPLRDGEHVAEHANLWRLTDDFWDEWHMLRHAFDTCHNWTPFRGAGHWPDPDMLPLGAIRVGPKMQRNWTRFTKDEQRTLMTLWCVSRAPLMFGGHMPWNDEFTESLITNDEVLAVNQHSSGNRQLFRSGNAVAWVAEAPDSKDRYLALFNVPEREIPFDLSRALFTSPVVRGPAGRQVIDIKADVKGAKKLFLVVTDAGDGISFDHADWIEPRLIGSKGELKLTDLKWKSAKAGWKQPLVNKNVNEGEIVRDGKAAAFGIGTHSTSVIEYELPEGYDRFEAVGVLDPGSNGRGSVRFEVYSESGLTTSTTVNVSVALRDLGFDGAVRLRDLWQRKDIGEFKETFARPIAEHASELFRISPVTQ